MTAKVGQTWWDGGTGQQNGVQIASYNFLDNFGVSRWQEGFYVAQSHCSFGTILGANNCNDCGILVQGYGSSFGDINACIGNAYGFNYVAGDFVIVNNIYAANSNRAGGVSLASPYKTQILGTINANFNNYSNVYIAGGGRLGLVSASSSISGVGFYANNSAELTIDSLMASSNFNSALVFNTVPSVIVKNFISANNQYSAVLNQSFQTSHYLYNASMQESPSIVFAPGTSYVNSRIYSQGEGGIFGKNKVYTDGASIYSDTAYAPTDYDYTVAITDHSRNADYPVIVRIPTLVFNGPPSGLCTFSFYAILSDPTKIFAKLVFPRNTIPGTTADIVKTITSSSYTLYTVTFTPTQQGSADIYFYVWSGTSTTDYCRIADFNFTQV
jgi:hypothetical protein